MSPIPRFEWAPGVLLDRPPTAYALRVDQVQRLVALLREGMKAATVAERLGVSRRVVYLYARRAGLPYRPGYPRERLREITPELAREMRTRLARGEALKLAAAALGISRSAWSRFERRLAAHRRLRELARKGRHP